jgi:hypothetical protein
MLTIIDSILNMFNPCELEALGGICILKGSHTDASGAERYIKDWCAEHGLSAMIEISQHPFLGKYAAHVPTITRTDPKL